MDIKNLLDVMNYNLSRSSRGVSDLGHIQRLLIDLFLLQPKSKEQVDSFEANLFSNPATLSRNINYGSIIGIDEYFKNRCADNSLDNRLNSQNIR